MLISNTTPLSPTPIEIASKGLNAVETGWNYVGKTMLLSRHILNATIKGCTWFVKRCSCSTSSPLSDAVRRLKLFTIISIPINLQYIPTLAGRVKQNFLWKDAKETVLAVSSLAALLMDTVDTVATFTNAALQTLSLSVPAVVSAVGMPLSYGMLSLGAANRVVRIWDMTKFLKETRNVKLNGTPEEVKAELQTFLNAHLPRSADSDERRHTESNLEKKSNGRALRSLKQLEALAAKEGFTAQEAQEAAELLAGISRHVCHERKIHAVYLTANAVALTAMAFFTLSIGAVAPYVLLAASTAVRLSAQIYQDKKS